MSSNIIPGVSDQLGVRYLTAYNDESVKYLFTVFNKKTNTTNRFSTCFEAVNYTKQLLDQEEHNLSKFNIYLNQVKGSRLLSEDEIVALAAFESDEELYTMFQMYAEKMSRPGRVAARAAQDKDDEDEDDEYNPDNWDGDAQDEDEDDHDELRAKLHDANQKIAQLEKQVEKTRRDLAMEWIMSMNSEEFEQRLISNDANYKLPDFPRAQLGDEDYPDFTKLQRQTAAPDYKHVLTPEEHDLGRSNYACLHRRDLLYISEEDFRACAYEEPIYAIYDGPWPPIRDTKVTRVSDFDVYG